MQSTHNPPLPERELLPYEEEDLSLFFGEGTGAPMLLFHGPDSAPLPRRDGGQIRLTMLILFIAKLISASVRVVQ